jgi:hypothetical protein
MPTPNKEKRLHHKDIVIITSAGRTGTGFLGNRLSEIIEDSFSVHEPDLYKFSIKELLPKLRTFGFRHLFYDRYIKDHGVRQLSERNLLHEQINNDAVDEIKRLRTNYYSKIENGLIIEAYPAWFGLIEELYEAFQNVKVVSIVRDPREWIRSVVNRDAYYGKRDLTSKLWFQTLDPSLINDEKYVDRWAKMSWIEKLAWRWTKVYSEVKAEQEKGNTDVYRFEDLFQNGYSNELERLLEQITKWPDRSYKYKIPRDFLKKKVNINFTYEYPRWNQWSDEEKKSVLEITGDLISFYDYKE